MYDELLKNFEENLVKVGDYKNLGELLDLIIKIKTIQYMDVQAELVAYSRRVSRN